ncbi:unannotated protein [freshwater metagenome]|uniref:Unannotated protein n=1 Tax=freshwater metagenome TaxID=449393 RepID=A0A6J6IDX1_9ZZZZ|nr:hypothetical protein [Actinomycetota bacterium]
MSFVNPSFVTPDAVRWALAELKKRQSDQSALFLQIALARFPKVPPRAEGEAPFIGELMRYIGVPKPNGSHQIFNPMRGEWLAENYVGSTIFGRLLNGSHWWTIGEMAILERVPSTGLPAVIRPTEETFQKLMQRTKSPYLHAGQRLPRVATAILYFRGVDVGQLSVSDPETLWRVYFEQALGSLNLLEKLFERPGENAIFWGELFQTSKPTQEELRACYPVGGPKAQIGIYASDMEEIQSKLKPNENEADFISRLLRGNA